MKRKFVILLTAMCCIWGTMPAQAQFQWGIKGGVNMSQIDWNGGYKGNKNNATGFFIGPMAEITIPIISLGIDGAFMYSQRGENEWRQQGIEIPLHLKYTFGSGRLLGIFIAAGPDLFFNFRKSNRVELEKMDKQVGLDLGAGLKLFKHLQLGINYQIPLGDSFRLKELKKSGSKTKTWQVSFAYFFN